MHEFGVTIVQNLRPRWNIAPNQQALIITRKVLQNEAVMAQWGIPSASLKESLLINARSETVEDKSTFRDAFQYTRCLVVASGWYEWSSPKKPWYLRPHNAGVTAFAGLFFGPADQLRFVILTTAADGGLADIHHRAPLILSQKNFDFWIGDNTAIAADLLRPAPATKFNWYRVGRDVGKVSNDHPALAIPLSDDELVMEEAPQGDLFT